MLLPKLDRPISEKGLRELGAQDQHDTSLGPCVQCPSASRCGPQRLACEQFASFSQWGGDIRWRAAPRQPSRQIFERLLSG